MLIKLEGLELGEDGLRIVVLVPVKKPVKPGLRKGRTIETTGEAIEAVPLKAAGGQR